MAFIRHLKPSNPEVGLGGRVAATRSDSFGTLEAALAEPVPEGYICERIVDANGVDVGPQSGHAGLLGGLDKLFH
jgi:hypothetical protein